MTAYGYDSRRRQRIRRKARRPAQRKANVRRFRISLILTLVSIAAIAIVWDHMAVRPDFTSPPVEGHTAYATTALPHHH